MMELTEIFGFHHLSLMYGLIARVGDLLVAARAPCIYPSCDKVLLLTQEEGNPMLYQLRHGDSDSFGISALDVELHEYDNEPEDFNLPKQAWDWLRKIHLTVDDEG